MSIRTTPAKSSPPVLPLPDDIRSMLRATDKKKCFTTGDLPNKIGLNHYHNDLSVFCYVKFISLSFCNTTDVSPLRAADKVSLFHCPFVKDVSSLKYVRTLSLAHCDCITDVSSLQYVENLVLRKCDGITDVSTLGTVKTLCIDGCSITSVSMLVDVQITLRNHNVKHYHGMKNVTIDRSIDPPRIVFQAHNSKKVCAYMIV